MIIRKLCIVSSLVLVISSTTAWNYIITRNSTLKLHNSIFDSIDKFNISECSSSDDICTKFGGQKLQKRCQCVCSQDKSTFGFYNSQWGCTKNSIVQQHADCGYALQRPGIQGDHNPLFTLPVLGVHKDNNYVLNIPRNKSCKVIAANATFLECDGTWGKLTESNVKRKLAFQDHRLGTVYVGPYQPSSPADPSLDGRVIRIPIKCEGLTWDPSQCVTFKIKGQLTCLTRNVPGPSLVPYESTQTPSIPTTGTRKIKGSDDPTPAAALIAGSVVGAVIFIIFIVVIITLVICLRREKAKANKKTSEGMEETERTEARSSEHQVPGADLVIAQYAQFSGEGMMPTAIDNQESSTAREVDPYYQSPREGMVTGQENRGTRYERETESDYQYPRVGMRTCQDTRMSESNGEIEPDYQYPRARIISIGQDPNYVNRPVANRDDSPYEIMNPLYQNVGSRKQVEPPYVNIC